ncbi:hypothetical protein C8J57DRAFT_1247468 [Mycena rebaudengoi]|nr:hypothetical protein C8J57DRAFT_1247468 [Mycena rebaudengoi]
MEPSAHQRFVMTNVVWPQGDRFFLPDGGLLRFLRENMWFKVFLLVMPVFTNAYCSERVASLPAAEIMDLRRRMKELVRHMFFAAQIHQNEFRISYDPVPVPSEAAWMFHVILCLLHIIGFENDKDMSLKTDQPFDIGVTEMQLAEAQAKFLLGAALQMYVDNIRAGAHSLLDYKMYDEYGWVDKNFVHRTHPDAFVKMPAGIPLQESLDIEDILGAWRARYRAEGPHKSPGAFQMSKATVSIERQEREEVELMRTIIAASTMQSIAAETRQSAQGWMTCRRDDPEDQFFHQGVETAHFPDDQPICVSVLTSYCQQGSSLSVDEGYESADEDEAEMAAVYAMRKARGSISSDDSLPALISVPSSSSEL